MDSLSLLLLDALEAIDNFFISGGPVLYLIAGMNLLMWVLIFERLWFYQFNYKKLAVNAIKEWDARDERRSWYALAIRDKVISEIHIQVNQNLALIKTLIMLAPLFGLLGTVTGMIEVFTVLSITGGGDAKSMAGGVSRATIPAMAGMVTLLAGLFANIYLTKKAKQKRKYIEEHLTMDH